MGGDHRAFWDDWQNIHLKDESEHKGYPMGVEEEDGNMESQKEPVCISCSLPAIFRLIDKK